jgi:hypothetical protein
VSVVLGIDIAKKKFDVALLRDGKFRTKALMHSQKVEQNQKWPFFKAAKQFTEASSLILSEI